MCLIKVPVPNNNNNQSVSFELCKQYIGVSSKHVKQTTETQRTHMNTSHKYGLATRAVAKGLAEIETFEISDADSPQILNDGD